MTSAPLRKDAAHNRQRIITAGRRMVDEGEPLLLNDVARRAGVGVATTYRNFPTPEALLETIAAPCFASLIDEARAALAAPDPGEGLTALLGTIVDAQVTDASLSPVMAAARNALPQTQTLKQSLVVSAAEVLSRAQNHGAVHRDLTVEDLVAIVCGIAHAAHVRAHDREAVRVAARRYLHVALHGVRP
ncbi:TetR/AcrR family transcriptional regulator [Mangrovihabitans endophyticus]|uniref:Putative transcriptional regulatory protein TetR n=1 Tax=Mangrovihabitans endophyticus TaxID=1751298 RepID=A0A8J3FR93_9ACTN|nr:TetR/AcrR family transcriptional regulator [Mangrovihabitans endophyticus]GGL07693.1 putative transcriptional regulatory protein TetR [Mangrovihabitans endophyticus]